MVTESIVNNNDYAIDRIFADVIISHGFMKMSTTFRSCGALVIHYRTPFSKQIRHKAQYGGLWETKGNDDCKLCQSANKGRRTYIEVIAP